MGGSLLCLRGVRVWWDSIIVVRFFPAVFSDSEQAHVWIAVVGFFYGQVVSRF
jgi:hypothetical protein